MADSWETVAHKLGARMIYQNECDAHRVIADGVAQGCPFCCDRKAYAAYVAKVRSVRRPTDTGGAA